MSGTTIRDTWTKPKGVGSGVGVGNGWEGAGVEGEMETTVCEQQLKKKRKTLWKIQDFNPCWNEQ